VFDGADYVGWCQFDAPSDLQRIKSSQDRQTPLGRRQNGRGDRDA
jgi:hypothetical protein